MTTITNPDTLRSKYLAAYDLMLSNLLTADTPIRVEAIEEGCLDQLLEIRDDIACFLENEKATLNNIENPAVLAAYFGVEAAGTPSDVD